ncbi:unnamed protein product [Triticum aestivum]|uniref:Uncharacterized protein n=1 Tax=Triticum aestivum TaxID=4565 RepID=A0A7H4LC49_WHEAT|nr:unnamed protein product [Triticum aestivum]
MAGIGQVRWEAAMPEIVRCASTLSPALLRALSLVHGSPLSTELQIHDTSSEDTVDDVVEDEWVLTKIHLYMYVVSLLRLKIYVWLKDISEVKFPRHTIRQ